MINTNKLVHIGNSDISIKEYNGQRVVTLKDIDMVHGRPDGTARKRFNDNRNHFIEGEDFFVITQPSEIRTLGLERPQGGVPEKVVLATEQGYLMLLLWRKSKGCRYVHQETRISSAVRMDNV